MVNNELNDQLLMQFMEPFYGFGNYGQHSFWVIDHPTARGVNNHYFEQVGRQIATSGE
jgi:hypothetical protein